MIDTTSHRLDGLEPDNLLAFLALLGLMRALETADGTLHPRAAWDVDAAPLRPRLILARTITSDEVSEYAAKGIEVISGHYDFGDQKDLKYSRKECRTLLLQEARAARTDAREQVDLLAALITDAATKNDKEEMVAPTPLCLLSGQGNQYFLERLSSIPGQPSAKKDKSGKRLAEKSAAESLTEALFHTWHRNDHLTSSFRWDPEEDVRHALMAGDPSNSVYKPGTQYGANRLAAIGLSVLTLIPEFRAGRVRPSIIGGVFGRDGFSFRWPIWREPATLSAVRALLAHPGLRENGGPAHLGVDHVMVARRILVGKFMNFSRARPNYRT